MTTVRLARVKATGKRYVVQQISFGEAESTVHCWGDVVSFKGLSAKHEAAVKFPLSEVEILKERRTAGLLRELVSQHIRSLRERGYEVVENRRTYRVL